MNNKIKNNLIGETFGRLKIIKLDLEKSQETKRIYYICECNCKNKTIKSFRQDSLVSGNVQSCGCLNKDLITERSNKNKKCNVEHCNNLQLSKGYCKKHYEQMRVFGYIKTPKQLNKDKICIIENCNKQVKCNNLCKQHYYQYTKYGQIYNENFLDKNNIIKHKDYAEIILKDKKLFEVGKTTIDLDDIEKCEQYKWHLTDKGYVKNSEHIYLSRFITNASSEQEVDHIDGNPLNNRKNNLRLTNHINNSKNTIYIRANNTTNHKGVFYRKDNNKWRAIIIVDNKRIDLGTYNSKEEAIKVRQEAEIKYFDQFSSLLCRPQYKNIIKEI